MDIVEDILMLNKDKFKEMAAGDTTFLVVGTSTVEPSISYYNFVFSYCPN